ncbi:MAG: AAA family ATPase [Actinomycetota bacterium]|nr:AAA family ATPase [Actinomycetota bacterium]
MPHFEEKLVGRKAELHTVDRLLRELAGGRGGILEIVGEPGIGKTRLVAECVARAEGRKLLALSARASEFERDVPFGPVVDGLDDYLASLAPRRLEHLGADCLSALAPVFPAVARWAGEARPVLQAERHRIHSAIRALLQQLGSHQPLVLALDDLHWVDVATIELLAFLLRRGWSAPVLLVVSFRPAQAPPSLVRALDEVDRRDAVERMELASLSPEEGAELVRQVGARPGVEAALYREAGGNPFYLEELARAGAQPLARATTETALGGEVPRAVAAALQQELVGLAPRGRTLLEGAAVAGDPFEFDLAAEIAQMPEESALESLDDLLERRLIGPTDVPRRFRFRHPIVRRAVYESSGPGWRLGGHARAAEALKRRDSPVATRAHHVEASARRGDESAVALLSSAADDVAARAPAIAARWYNSALHLLPPEVGRGRRLALLVPMATSLGSSGRIRESRDALREALGLIQLEATDQRVRVAIACARMEYLLRRHAEAMDLLQGTLNELPDRDSAEAGALKLAIAMARIWSAEEDAAVWAGAALADARRSGDRNLELVALSALAMGTWVAGETTAAVNAATSGSRLIDSMSDDELAGVIDALVLLCWTGTILDRSEDSRRHGERGLRVAREHGQGRVISQLQYGLGYAYGALGRIHDAAAQLDDAVEPLSQRGVGRTWHGLCSSAALLRR